MEIDHRRGSSADSGSHVVFVDQGSGDIDRIEPYPNLRVRLGSSDHFEINPELTDGSVSSTYSESDHEVADDDGSVTGKDSEPHYEIADGDGSVSSKHSSRSQPEAADVDDGALITPVIKLGSSSSSSSRSSTSSDDLFQVDTIGCFNPRTSSPSSHQKLDEDLEKASKPEEHELGPTVASPVSNTDHEYPVRYMLPTQSPPVQVMERPGDLDPLRIPPSVFERTASNTPLDWSAASNESLFSIHLGNSSLSKDASFFLSGELVSPSDFTKSGELPALSPRPPVSVVGTGNNESPSLPAMEGAKQNSETENTPAVHDATKAAPYGHQHEVKKPNPAVSWRTSSASNKSGDSVRSFAFPIRKKRKKKCTWPSTSCYCSNCSWAFCYCTWPSCKCRWPSCCCCSGCSWAFCYCWNCSHERWCRHCCILADGIKSGSHKTEVQGEDRRQPAAVAAVCPKSKSASRRWFHCFSCCPSCSSCHPRCCC